MITSRIYVEYITNGKESEYLNELIKVNYETEHPTVSARDLHEGLEVGTKFATWFPRMAEYGFVENVDYKTCYPNLGSENHGGQNMVDYQISVDMAKQICMIQRTEKGRQYRQYFLDLEKAWNTPEQVFARALKMAEATIDGLKLQVAEMKPPAILGKAITTADTSILVGDLAKILKQNGIQMGAQRLFQWMRDNGYLIKRKGTDWNLPTQKSMEMGLFEIKESVHIDGNGCNKISRTPKVTGKGQQYFINKFLGDDSNG